MTLILSFWLIFCITDDISILWLYQNVEFYQGKFAWIFKYPHVLMCHWNPIFVFYCFFCHFSYAWVEIRTGTSYLDTFVEKKKCLVFSKYHMVGSRTNMYDPISHRACKIWSLDEKVLSTNRATTRTWWLCTRCLGCNRVSTCTCRIRTRLNVRR